MSGEGNRNFKWISNRLKRFQIQQSIDTFFNTHSLSLRNGINYNNSTSARSLRRESDAILQMWEKLYFMGQIGNTDQTLIFFICCSMSLWIKQEEESVSVITSSNENQCCTVMLAILAEARNSHCMLYSSEN